MKMKRIIKITESQLIEAEGGAFKYLDTNDDTKPFNGQSTVTAQGKLNGEENAEPIFTDKIGKQRTPQSWARYRMYGNLSQRPNMHQEENIFEGVDINDKDGDDIPDYYENVGDMGGLDTLSDNNENNNLTVMPKGIDTKLDILINSTSSLTPKQKAMVVNTFIEKCDISQIPNAWKKELMYKIMSNKDNPNQNKIR